MSAGRRRLNRPTSCLKQLACVNTVNCQRDALEEVKIDYGEDVKDIDWEIDVKM